MAARTGKQYLDGLRDSREVWLEGERVLDVVTHPTLSGAARSMAALFDLQHTHANVCLAKHAATGELVNITHLIPRSREDLERRHVVLERIARFSVGQMGRSPDYLNVTLAGFAGRADVWKGSNNEQGAENLLRFQDELSRRDLALTHTIVHPTVDRRAGELGAVGGEIALHKVADSEHGIIVRGARVLATLAPFADEIVVYPGQPLPKDATRHALAFSIPLATAGLKFFCRGSYSHPGHHLDRPFSSRFDEQDAFVIFDDVEVPRERVFLDGNTQIYNDVMAAGWVANVMQQTTIRAEVKLRFSYELATRMCEAINADDPSTREMLGELWTYAELTRAALVAAEMGAHEWGNGTWFCDDRPFRALRPTLPKWFPRVTEIIKLVGSHNLLATPIEAELNNPQIASLLEKYLQGANSMSASERVRIFRAAWDFIGSALGSRNELYERFYLASASRTYQMAHHAAQRESSNSYLDEIINNKGF